MMKKIVLLMAGLTIWAMGCEQKRPDPVLHEKVEGTVPVSLPNRPVFDTVFSQTEPVKNVYSPWGAIFHQKELFDQEIRVSGVITEVSDDCPQMTQPGPRTKRSKWADNGDDSAPVKQRCDGLWVRIASSDHPNRAIQVVGYHPYYHPFFEPGMAMEVTGKYVQFGNVMGKGYVQYRDGIILTKELHNMGVDKTGYFTTDRSEISSMISQGTMLYAPQNY